MRRLTSLLPALAAAPLVAALLSVPAHAAVAEVGAGGSDRYVAFGDSFVSGPGIVPQRPEAGGCARSEKNFPSLVAQGLKVASYVDASCSGATSIHFTESQVNGTYTNAPQLDQLSEDTTLVTFGTMGGNDIGLIGLAIDCALGEVTCVPAPGVDPLATKFADVEGRLISALDETKRRAPLADVAVVGYGTYLPPRGCSGVPVSADEADYIQGQIDRLSDLLKRLAANADVHFIDQREIPEALDHTSCAAPEQQWIRGLDPYGDGILLHPSTAGMKATADHVLAEIAQFRDDVAEPTKAQRMKALRAKAKGVKVATVCHHHGRQVRVRVNGGKGAIDRVALTVGGKRVARDNRAPFVLKAKAKKIKRAHGKVRVSVTLRDKDLKLTRTRSIKHPRCAR